MKHHKEKRAEHKDNQRMIRSGAADSGYHAPSAQDIDDIRKNHRTAGKGRLNADEAVRIDAEQAEGFPADGNPGENKRVLH